MCEKLRLIMILEALDILSGVFISPRGTFEQIRDRRPITLALITAIFLSLIFGLILLPNPPELIEVVFSLTRGTVSLSATLPVWVLLFLAILALQAAFIHLTASILNGKGSYPGMFCGLCFAYLPGLFTAPLAALRAILASSSGNTVYQAGFAALCVWIFLLGMAAVQCNYRMTLPRAAAVCAISVMVLVVFPAVVAVIVISHVMT